MSANLYRRNGIWWGRLTAAGREHRRSLRTRDRAEAQKRIEVWRKEITAEAHFGERRLTWKAAVLRYVTEVMPQAVKPATAQRYAVSFRQVDPWLASTYVDQIDRKTIADLVAHRRKAEVANATINRYLTAISAVLSFCVDERLAEGNAARDFNRRRLTKERREPIIPPEPADVDRVIARAPGLFAAVLRFLRDVGARQEEAASLEWPQVDLRAGEITFHRTKTSRPRTVRIGPEVVAWMAQLPRALAARHVFWHGSGERYRNVASRFAQMVASAQISAQQDGVPFRPFRCHDLRHAYAIRELKAGRDIYDLSRHLGHSSVKTPEIYLGHVAGGGHKIRHSDNGSTPEGATRKAS